MLLPASNTSRCVRLAFYQRRAAAQHGGGLINDALDHVLRRGNVAHQIDAFSRPDRTLPEVVGRSREIGGFNLLLLSLEQLLLSVPLFDEVVSQRAPRIDRRPRRGPYDVEDACLLCL